MPRNRLTLLWLAFAVLVSCNSGSPLESRKLGAVTIVPNRTTVNVTEAVAVSDGTNLATVTAGGALNVNSTTGGSTTGPSVSVQIATVSGVIRDAGATQLYALQCNNRNAAIRWLQIFNATAAPVSGQTPTFAPYLEPASGMIVIGTDLFTASGVMLDAGFAFGHSIDSGTYNAATAGDHDCNFVYQ
jgi:hypothetical protein